MLTEAPATAPSIEAAQPVVIYTIYGLRDPRDGRIRYVGCTKSLRNRVHGHRNNPQTIELHAWMLELRAAGLGPEVVTLETAVGAAAGRVAERHWIEKLGADLLNRVGVRSLAERKDRVTQLAAYETVLRLDPESLTAKYYLRERQQLLWKRALRTSEPWLAFCERRGAVLARLDRARKSLFNATQQRVAYSQGDGLEMVALPTAIGVKRIEQIERLVAELEALIANAYPPGGPDRHV